MVRPYCSPDRLPYQYQAISLIRRFVPKFDPDQNPAQLDLITSYLYYQKVMKAEAITDDFITNEILRLIAEKKHLQVLDKDAPAWRGDSLIESD
jgi:hypothetical protein